MTKMTKKYAKEVLEIWKDKTNYFNGSLTVGQMESMLQYRMGFGLAETEVIVMALVLAGAKFSDN